MVALRVAGAECYGKIRLGLSKFKIAGLARNPLGARAVSIWKIDSVAMLSELLRQPQIVRKQLRIKFLAGTSGVCSRFTFRNGFELPALIPETEVHGFSSRLDRDDEGHVRRNARMQ